MDPHAKNIMKPAVMYRVLAIIVCSLWSAFAPERAVAQQFTDIGAGLTGVGSCSLAWGDYDNDGDLDLALAGTMTGSQVSKIYRNDAGTFTDIGANLTGVTWCSLAWADYDSDGDLDLAIAGYTGSAYVTWIYRNDGGTFGIGSGVTGVDNCSLVWGDYDNDGDLDFALAGHSPYRISTIYVNYGGSFGGLSGALTDVLRCSLAWGDYDNDGDLDLALAGWAGGPSVSKIYRNDAGTFTEINAGLTAVSDCSLAWGDYDNDGDLDLALAGFATGGAVSKIYRNDAGTFTDINAGLPGVEYCSLAWGDYDNDGDLDLALAGLHFPQGGGPIQYVTKIYRNDGGGVFTDIGAGLTGVGYCSLAWGDYDNDGDLDLALAGYTGSACVSKIYRNDGGVFNIPPSSPSDLSATVSGTDITFSWTAANDTQTPAAGLSYNLRVGTSSGDDNVVCGMADLASGLRRIPVTGNAQKRLSWKLKNVMPGMYYWSAQAVDTALAGSAWASEDVCLGPSPVISGYVYLAGVGGFANVTMTGLPGDPSTDGDGYYSAAVDYNWSGTVTPTKAGYTFSPPSRTYTDVTANLFNQTYSTLAISGYVVTADWIGIAGVTMAGLPGEPPIVTDGDGYYSGRIDYGWSGTVTPTKAGYTFSPPSQTYTDVTESGFGDYTGTLDTFTISGHVLRAADSTGISGVIMTGLPGDPSTDNDGYYSVTVDYGWSGTVTPTKGGGHFSPPSQTYANVTTDLSDQDYSGTIGTFAISGYVLAAGDIGLSGVTMTGLPGSPSTNDDGYYCGTVEYGWSGTATPTKTEYLFDPHRRTYANVTANVSNENYAGGFPVCIFGHVRTAGGTGISGVIMSGLLDDPRTDSDGYYVGSEPYGWSGTVTPTKGGCVFTPSSRSYPNLTVDQSEQDYAGPRQLQVDGGAPPGGNGLTWASAFNFLQDALAAAAPNDFIWVAAGTYRPDRDAAHPGGTGDRSATFQLASGVAIYGGCAGLSNPSNPDARDILLYETILSGDLAGDDLPGFGNKGENAYHVVTGTGADATALLNGFFISGGNANEAAPSPDASGGGMLNGAGSSPTIADCIFVWNAAQDGAGMFNNDSSPTVVNCKFERNAAVQSGGAIRFVDCAGAAVANCRFIANWAGSYGGAIGGGGSLVTITNCTFSGNWADLPGGAISVPGTMIANNCVFWGNAAPRGPQAYLPIGTDATFSYCCVEGAQSSIYREPGDSLNLPGVIHWGLGNIDAAPRLTPDGHLGAGSSCIDAGDNNAVPPTITTDLDGEPRILGNAVDLGADELVDSDVDGLPDWWESKYSGSTIAADPNADLDGDGLTNLQEYEEYGSNPIAAPYYVDAALGDDANDGRAPEPQGGGIGPKATIQAALDLAQNGDTVLVAAGWYLGELDYAFKSVVVRAPDGPDVTAVQLDGFHRAVNPDTIVGTFAVLEGFGVWGGNADYGGGIKAAHTGLMLKHYRLVGNSATQQGGGIYSEVAAMTIDDLVIDFNSDPNANAGVFISSHVNLRGPLLLPETDGDVHVQAMSSWFDGPGGIDIAGWNTLRISGVSPGAPPTVIRSNITGTGTIVIDVGQQLTIAHGAVVDLSGDAGGGCADTSQSGLWGRIEINGTLLVQNSTIRNTNVDVLAGDFGDGATIYNNQINMLQNPPGWGGEFYVEGTSTIECNVIYSEGDRFLDLDPDPNATSRPNIGTGEHRNKFYLNMVQGTGTEQGELLELRAVDHDNAVGDGKSGAYVVTDSEGHTDTWALELLEVQPNAKVNLTNRQGFVFQDSEITIPEAIYVKQVKLHPYAVLNTGMQRLYYQTLVGQNDQALYEPDPVNYPGQYNNGSRIVDVPLLGFSLKVIAMEDDTEYSVRVRTRLRDPADQQFPTKAGYIARLPVPNGPSNGAMQMLTHAPGAEQATSVSAHGAFARAGEDEIIVAFDYLFCGNETDELVVYLTDSPEVGSPAADNPTHYVEVARVYPPLAGRLGAIGSNAFATFFGNFPREGLNFTRGTYVELELRGADACVWIDNWDPQVKCLTPTCGDFNGDYAATGVDFLYVLGEYGLTLSATHPKWCLDRTNGDHYVDVGDVYAWDTRLHDPTLLNLCGGGSKSGGGDKDGPRGTPVTLPAGALIMAGKQGGQVSGIGQQDDFIYVKDPAQVSVQVNGSTATTIINPNTCLNSPVSPASDPNASGHYRGNGRLVRNQDGTAYQLHGSEGLIGLTDAAHVIPYGQVTFGSSTVKVGVNPANGNGVPIADAVFSPTSTTVVYVAPVLVTAPGYAAYKAAAKLSLLPSGNPPYTVQQIYGLNPRTDTRVTVRTVGGQPIFEPDFQRLREIEIDGWGNLFVLSAQADNDNDWVLAYNEATGNSSERCILLSGSAPACCGSAGSTLQGPTAMALSADGSTMYLASSVNDPAATSTSVYRFTINRGGSQEVTGLTPAGVVQVQGMRHVSALLEKPSTSDLWVLGTIWWPAFAEYTTFSTDCAANPNCVVPMWPRLAVIPPNVTTAAAANMTCHDLALPISALFTDAACGTGDFDGDGLLSMLDVQLFVAALLDPAPSPETICTGDLSYDDALDGRDIQPLVTALLEE